ncbi:MAG: ribokinase [Sphaerochaeta sp.]
MAKKVVVIGSVNYDNFLQVDTLPLKGETKQALSYANSCGGKGANQAIQCAKLGLDTRMVARVGNDTFGSILYDNFKNNNVNNDMVKVTDGPSGIGYVISALDGSLFSTILNGANFEITTDDIDEVSDDFDRDTIVVLQLEIPSDVVEYTIKEANKKGARIVLNAAPAVPIDINLFDLCELVIFNEAEAMFYTETVFNSLEEAERVLRDFGKKNKCDLCFTLGPLGALYYRKGDIFYCPAIDVPVVETTGAGDSFIGGLVYAMNRNENIETMLNIASLCSAYTIQEIGTTTSMPTEKELYEGIKKYL